MATRKSTLTVGRQDSALVRFMRFVHPEPNSGCWLWMGHQDALGDGAFWLRDTMVKAHRSAYRAMIGTMHDASSKGRMSRGEQHAHNKLTCADVLDIRRLVAEGELQQNVADRFGINPATVSRIARKSYWKWLTAATVLSALILSTQIAGAQTYDMKAYLPNFNQTTTHNLHVDQALWPPMMAPGLFWTISTSGDAYIEACGARSSDGAMDGPLGVACDAYLWRFDELYTVAGFVVNASDCGGPGFYCGGAPWPPIRTVARYVDAMTLPLQRIYYLSAGGGKCPNGNQSPCDPAGGHVITQIHSALTEWPGGLVMRIDVYAVRPDGSYQFSEHFWLGELPLAGGGTASGLRRFSHREFGKTAESCQALGGYWEGGPQSSCLTVDALLLWAPK